MRQDDTSITVNITSGPDRMSLAMALFEMDFLSEDIYTPNFRFAHQLGELKGTSVRINKLRRESDNSVKLWHFEGKISARTIEKSGEPITSAVTGYYNLDNRTGWLRFKKV